MSGEQEQDPVVKTFNAVRKEIKRIAETLNDERREAREYEARDGEDRGEVIANLTLAFRHLEDASMRMGKAIQARDGGVSVYDRATTVGA